METPLKGIYYVSISYKHTNSILRFLLQLVTWQKSCNIIHEGWLSLN